jgi:hypothetical protein
MALVFIFIAIYFMGRAEKKRASELIANREIYVKGERL